MWLGGSPLPRIVVGAQRFVPPQAPIGVFLSPFHVAARSEIPSGISPVVAMRQSAISSFLASATIIVLRVAPRASTVRARYHCASALSFWKMRKRQASWIMPRRTRALPALARPFPPPRTALVRRTRQTGVARHRFAVTHWSREHLMDEHISRFNADADNPSHLPDHGVRPGFSLLLQSFLTSLLDLPDLADDKA